MRQNKIYLIVIAEGNALGYNNLTLSGSAIVIFSGGETTNYSLQTKIKKIILALYID